MKRIVVTGAKGGTGRSIVKILQAAGDEVVPIDLLPPGPTDFPYLQLDLVNDSGLNEAVAGADGLIHMGSVPCDAFWSRTTVFKNVVNGGFNVLQACANAGVRRVVIASSMEVYGGMTKVRKLPVTESSPLRADNIYASGKILLEKVAADFARWYGMSIAAFRLGRIVYEDSFEERFKRHLEIPARGTDVLWNYVDGRDVATACRLWLESDIEGFHPFNVAAPDIYLETPVRDLIAEFLPEVNEIDDLVQGIVCPYMSTAIREALGWTIAYDWRRIRDEAR